MSILFLNHIKHVNSLVSFVFPLKEEKSLHLYQTFLLLFQGQGLRRCVEEIVFTYTYPRLDMEVC